MKTAAVICEYNPFHNGHRHQLEYMKNTLGADFIIAVMSGNFVQRGEPALTDKYSRARTALLNGADLVIELPQLFAASSAYEFAAAGISIAVKSGIADMLCFGTEKISDIGIIKKYSELMYAPQTSDPVIREALKSGMTYPAAVSLKAKESFGAETAETLALSNNILAAAYVHALSHPEIFISDSLRTSFGNNVFPDNYASHTGYSGCAEYSGFNPAEDKTEACDYAERIKENAAHIEVCPIIRSGSGYNDTELGSGFASASAIRKQLGSLGNIMQFRSTGCFDGSAGLGGSFKKHVSAGNASESTPFSVFSRISGYVPKDSLDTLKEAFAANTLVFPDDLSTLLQVRLLDAAMHKCTLTEFLDVSREISDRLLNNADRIMSFEERAVHTKTRQYTYSRIQRALLHIVLGIGEDEFRIAKRNGYADYIRILGFRRDACEKGLLNNLKKNALVPVITKTADYKELLKRDIYRDQIYFSLKNQKGELQRSPVIV